jgi:hypothetical protein
MTSHSAREHVQAHDHARASHGGRWLRSPRKVWTRVLATAPAQEERRRSAEGFTSASGPPSAHPSDTEPGSRMRTRGDKTRQRDTNSCDGVRVNNRQQNTATLPVCEVCSASCCIITRRPPAGSQCLCTVELHVPLDMSDRNVSLYHECASCRNARFAEAEQEREKRARSSLFSSSFSADGLAVSQL